MTKSDSELGAPARPPDRPPPAAGPPAEELFRAAFEHTNVAMVLTDVANRFVRVNAAFARMFGYSQAEMVGLAMADVTHPDDLAESYARREALLAGGGEFFQLEKRYVHRDGRVLWGLTNVSLIRDPAGRPLLYVGQVQDVTERKRAEESLRAARERLGQIIASSPAVLFTLTVEGGALAPTWVSDNVREVLGYAPEEALAPDWWAGHVHPDDRGWASAQIGRDLFALGRVSCVYRLRHPDGRYRWVRDDVRLVRDPAGRPVEAIRTCLDVSERKRLEEQFLQAQKMEAVGRLAGGVAHDFNNLLTVIIGFSELVAEGLRPPDPLRDPIEQIRRAGMRGAALTRQLLAFGRRQVLVPELVDVNRLLADMGKMLGRLIGEDIELRVVANPGLWKVRADPGQLEQVVMNLVVNARDAMPQGGKLTVETANVRLDEAYAAVHPGTAPGRYVLVAVSDTGCGMTPEVQAHIFEPFFTTKGPEKGTGLGLATVYGIVQQSGGRVEVYSEPGVGSSFKVYLPRAAEEGSAVRPAAVGAAPRRGSETLLLVEDEDAVRSLARVVLERAGYRVLEARDGDEAIAACQRHAGPVHLMVTDMVMPRMSGWELAQRLAPSRPEMRVLYLSGYTDDAMVHHGLITPDTPFLQKPFSPDALTRKVREVLG